MAGGHLHELHLGDEGDGERGQARPMQGRVTGKANSVERYQMESLFFAEQCCSIGGYYKFAFLMIN